MIPCRELRGRAGEPAELRVEIRSLRRGTEGGGGTGFEVQLMGGTEGSTARASTLAGSAMNLERDEEALLLKPTMTSPEIPT